MDIDELIFIEESEREYEEKKRREYNED